MIYAPKGRELSTSLLYLAAELLARTVFLYQPILELSKLLDWEELARKRT